MSKTYRFYSPIHLLIYLLVYPLICVVPGLTQICRAQNGAWYVIGARPNSLHGGRTPGAGVTTGRTAISVSAASGTIRLIYGNWYSGPGAWGESPNANSLLVRATVQRMGASASDQTPHRLPVTFNGSRTGICAPGALLYSDPIDFSVVAGETFYVYTSVDTRLPSGAAIPPTVTPLTTGGTLSAGNYQVVCTYVYPQYESIGSPAALATITGKTGSIGVTPPAVAGASGYRVYVTPVNAVLSSTQDALLVSGTLPFGSNFTIAAPPAPTAPTANATAYYPGGLGTGGGTATYGVGNGEGTSAGADLCDDGSGNVAESAGDYAHYSPVAVQGDGYGTHVPSVALIGDSIMAGAGDGGYLPISGGFGVRALTNQRALAYVPGVAPSFGYTDVAQPGETAALYANSAYSSRRLSLTRLCSNILCNYGTNDLGGGSATLVNNLLTIASYYTSLNIPFFQTTLLPKTRSKDGWQTVANQGYYSPLLLEGYRRTVNNWLRDRTGTATVLNETPFGVYSSTRVTTPCYAGSDGIARSFITWYPFREGTEVVKVNGVVQQVGTQYSYLAPSGTIASGINFGRAPVYPATITISYTKIPGFKVSAGPLADVFDTASAVEVTASGVLTSNSNQGGAWLLPPAGVLVNGTTTSGTPSGLTDATQRWAANQYKGYCVILTSGWAAAESSCLSYTTANGFMNVGFVGPAYLNTATFSPPPTASGGDGYEIYDGVTQDGVHPSSRGHLLMSAKIDVSRFR